MHGAKVKM